MGKIRGGHPFAYLGVDATNPPQLVIYKRAPTINDLVNYTFGTIWLITEPPQQVYMLCGRSRYNAEWKQLYPGAGSGATDFETDNGTASEIGGRIKIKGNPGKNILTSSLIDPAHDTVSVGLTDNVHITGTMRADVDVIAHQDITAETGHITTTLGDIKAGRDVIANRDVIALGKSFAGTGLIVDAGGIESTGDTVLHDLVAGGVVSATAGTGLLTVGPITYADLPAGGTNGQTLIAATGGNPEWATITSLDGSITFTPGPNTLDMSAMGSIGTKSFQITPTADYNLTATYEYIGATSAWQIIWDSLGGITVGDGAGIPAKLVAPYTGVYQFDYTIYPNWQINGGYILGVAIVNTTTNIGYSASCLTPGIGASTYIDTCMKCDAGDVIEFFFLGPTYSAGSQWSTIIKYRNLILGPPNLYGSFLNGTFLG